MALLMFPFVLCLLSGPFVVGGILLYMWHEKRQEQIFEAVMKRRFEAQEYVRKEHAKWERREKKAGRYYALMDDEYQAEWRRLEAEATEKFGVKPFVKVR